MHVAEALESARRLLHAARVDPETGPVGHLETTECGDNTRDIVAVILELDAAATGFVTEARHTWPVDQPMEPSPRVLGLKSIISQAAHEGRHHLRLAIWADS
jgi:hypothetical protein